MPKAKKFEVRELSLTSSFVAGGFSYQVDPRNTGLIGAGNKPLLFFRFEDADNRRTNLTSDDEYFSSTSPSQIIPVLSSTLGPGNLSNYPIYSTSTPYSFTNTVVGSRLTTDSSRQVRSIELGSNAGVFTNSLNTFIRTDNVSPTTYISSNGEGDDHVSVGVQDTTLTDALLANFTAITVSSWVKPKETELVPNFTGNPLQPITTTLHTRPIFRTTRTDGGHTNEKALISFGHFVSLINPTTKEYYHPDLHKRLYFRYADSYSASPSTWVTQERVDIVENGWSHVSVVVDKDANDSLTSATSVRFYCNGRLIKSFPYDIPGPQSKSISETAIDYAIGGVEDADRAVIIEGFGVVTTRLVVGSFFIGNIDDVAVWNRGLSGDEVAAIYHARRGAYPPGSGYLNSPPRVIISEQDNKAGTYPTQLSPADPVSSAPLYSDELTVETPKVNAELDLNFIDIPEHLSKLVFLSGPVSSPVTANWSSVTVGTEVEIEPGLVGSDGIQEQSCAYYIDGFDAPQQAARGDEEFEEFFVKSTGRMTYIKIQAPCDGVMNLKYSWDSGEPADDLDYDWPFYDVTSYEPTSTDIADAGTTAPDPITGGSGGSFATGTPESGVITISYSEGKWISIGVYTVDSVGGQGSLILENSNVLCGLTCPPGCSDEVALKFYRTNPVPKDIPTLSAASLTSPVPWTPVPIGDSPAGSDLIEETTDPCSWTIKGYVFTDPGEAEDVVTYIKIQAPCAGTMCFDWDWVCLGGGKEGDFGFWAIYDDEPSGNTIATLGTPIILDSSLGDGGSASDSGSICVSYNKDQWIVIGVQSDGSSAGVPTLTLTNSSSPPSFATPEPMCGLQCQGCASTIIPVDITDVEVPLPVKDPKLLPQEIAIGGPFLEVNTAQNNLDVSIRRVVERLVRTGNLEAARNILSIDFKPNASGKGVRLKQLEPGTQGNIPVYAKSLARNEEPEDTFGYKVLPYPRGVGLQSASRNQVFSFTGGRTSTARFPFGAPIDENDPTSLRNSLFRRSLASPNAGSVSVVGSGQSALVGGVSDQQPISEFRPYDETNSHQSFGIPGGSPLYGTQGEIYDEFFTRGSVFGPLDEPLRNKDRIVIDLSPSSETTLLHADGDAYENFPMAYFNFVTRRWEPIGFGAGVVGPVVPTSLQDVLETQYLGFSQAWGNFFSPSSTSNVSVIDPQLADEYTGEKNVFRETGWFSPIDTFGFPLHPKYHATGSQQLDCSVVVDRPFLLEKIVYEFSASMPNLQSELAPIGMGAVDDNEYRGSGGAFFILNQRKANPDPGQEASYTNVYVSENTSQEFGTPQDGGVNGPTGDYWSIPYDNGGIPRTMQLSPSGPNVYVDTVRDLVTFARIGTVWPTYDEEMEALIEPGFPHPATFMDLAVEVPASGTFSGEYTLAAPVRAPSQNSALCDTFVVPPGSSVSPGNIERIYCSKDSSTRNSIDIATGRAYNGEFFGPEIAYRVNGNALSKQIFAPKVDGVNSPYLIKPGDRLVFGWQSPTYFTLDDNSTEKTLKLLPGKGKLILYGSYLRDGKPIHNIFKDQLSSDSAHETIPSGPWVLDRFESEPQMMFSSSMREEHVTGTMLTRNADGTLSITDVGDLDIGGVRAVSARASDGNLRQRWSFFRNNRLFDSEEQYYDSMPPSPFDLLVRPGVITILNSYLANRSYFFVPLMLAGEQRESLTESHINTGSNKEFIGSFPFEERYAGIDRVKSINSKILTSKTADAYTYAGAGEGSRSLTGGVIFFPAADSGGGADFNKSNLLRAGGIAKNPPLDPFSLTSYWGSNIDEGIWLADSDDDTNPVSGTFSYGSGLPLLTRKPIGVGQLDQTTEREGISTNYHFSRFVGCFGDGYLDMIQLDSYQADSFTNTYPLAYKMIYRGVKHGLINPTPLFSNAVFSGTRYGQFRDLMEQRQYTRFSLNDSSLTDAAVEVVFIDRSVTPDINGSFTNNIVSGSATNSSNISPYATSEHPYDDALADADLIWDRGTPLPETLIAL